MTREKLIQRWMDLSATFFWAEEALAKEWHPKLEGAHKLSKDEQHKLAMAYCRAVAEEIVGKLTDEQIVKLYGSLDEEEEEEGGEE